MATARLHRHTGAGAAQVFWPLFGRARAAARRGVEESERDRPTARQSERSWLDQQTEQRGASGGRLKRPWSRSLSLLLLHHPIPPPSSQNKLRHHVQRGSRYPRRRDRLPGRHRYWYVSCTASQHQTSILIPHAPLDPTQASASVVCIPFGSRCFCKSFTQQIGCGEWCPTGGPFFHDAKCDQQTDLARIASLQTLVPPTRVSAGGSTSVSRSSPTTRATAPLPRTSLSPRASVSSAMPPRTRPP